MERGRKAVVGRGMPGILRGIRLVCSLERQEGLIRYQKVKMTFSPCRVSAVPNYYTIQTELLLTFNVRKQKSAFKNRSKCSNTVRRE